MKKSPRLDLNPSSADRWTTCTASPQFIKDNWDKLPPQDTKYNLEGTTAHEVAAAMLEGREPNLAECPTEIDKEMLWHAYEYAEYVHGLIEPGAIVRVEEKFPLWYMPERNAKVDVAIVNPRSIHIVDYKYGEGIPVSPIENLQGAIYARSVLEDFGGKMSGDFKIHVHIVQPRGRENAGAHVWESRWRDIQNFTIERVEVSARGILAKESVKPLVFAPSDKACQWCPAKGFCEARKTFLTEGIKPLAVIDDAMHFPPPQSLSVSTIAAIGARGDEIIKWLKDVQDYALAYVQGGKTLEGLKVVLSRGGNRYWTDPVKAAKLLTETTILKESEVVEKKTISPAAVEKLLGKTHKLSAELLDLVDKPPGKEVLTGVDDKREGVRRVIASEVFENLSNDGV